MLTIALVFAVSAADAKTSYLTSFTNAYPAANGSRIDNCLICHINADPDVNSTRNSYGIAWKNAGKNFATIENLDSDGDGVANKVEIDSLTYPGNAADVPNVEGEGEPPVEGEILIEGEGEGESGCAGCSNGKMQESNIRRILSDFLLIGTSLMVLTLLGTRRLNP
jgi:hypothetical protein